MKKKIALLLAGVMALSTLPMSVFAATDNAKVTVGVRGRLNANSSRSKTMFVSNYYGLSVYSSSAVVDNKYTAGSEGTIVDPTDANGNVTLVNDGTATTAGTAGTGASAQPVITGAAADTTAVAAAAKKADDAYTTFYNYRAAADGAAALAADGVAGNTDASSAAVDADAAALKAYVTDVVDGYNEFVTYYLANFEAAPADATTAIAGNADAWKTELNRELTQMLGSLKVAADVYASATGATAANYAPAAAPDFIAESAKTAPGTAKAPVALTNADSFVAADYGAAAKAVAPVYVFDKTAGALVPTIGTPVPMEAAIDTELPAAIAAYTYNAPATTATPAKTGTTVAPFVNNTDGAVDNVDTKAAATKYINDASDRDVAEAPVINISGLYGEKGAKFEIVLSQASGTPEWAGGMSNSSKFNDGITNAVNNSMSPQYGAFKVVRDPVSGEKQRLIFTFVETIDASTPVTIRVPVVASTANNTNPLMATVSNSSYNTNGQMVNIDDTTVTVATVTNDTADGNTTTSVPSTFSGKTNLKFNIKTKENVAGAFGSGYYIEPGTTTKKQKEEVVTYTLNSAFKFDGFFGDTAAGSQSNLAYADFALGEDKRNNTWFAVPAGKLVNDYNVNVTAEFRYGSDLNKLQVKYTFADDGTTPTKVPAALEIKDLTVVPKSGTSIGTDATFSVNPYTGSSFAKQTGVKAGTYADYSYKSALAYPDKAVPALQSGRLEFVPEDKDSKVVYKDRDVFSDDTEVVTLSDEFEDYHQAADLKVSELVAKSFINGRTIDFTFPEGVNIAAYEIINTDKSTVNVPKNEILTFENDTVNQAFDGNKLSITNYTHTGSTTDKASFIIRFYLAADANYTGDAAVTVSGDGLAGATLDPVTVATFAPAFKLDAKLNTIKSGVQQSSTTDIVISETEKGRFEDNETVYVKVDTANTATLRNAIKISDVTAAVTEGDLEIEKLHVSTDGYVTFKIANISSTSKPGTITLSNVKVSTAYGLPETNSYPFDVVVTTDAFDDVEATSSNQTTVSNGEGKFHNNLNGTSIRYGSLRTPYINVKNNTGAAGGDKVVVSPGSTTYTVAGVEKTMDVAPFIDAKTSSLMVPVRFIADGVGITEESGNLIWSANNKTVIIRNGNDTIEFPVGSNFYRINGAVVYNENNAVTQIVDGRTFVPFRTMGNVLGIPVTWDETARTATYN